MMREKRRYLKIVFEGSSAKLSFSQASRCVESAVLALFGERGLGQTRAKLVRFDEKTQGGIVKTTLAGTEKTIAAIATKAFFEEKPIAMRLKKMSGAIGKLA